ncbi:MAG: branched-chain amino acid ABC transporter permease [Chloroflexota bacterium]|nr:branched-chain amino acid ABC transporter permease [Chloroflexota bacterium]
MTAYPIEAIIIQALAGLAYGMVLFIIASGLTLVFGVMRVINFAHGSLYMLGAYLAAAVGGVLASPVIGFVGALAIAPLGVALIGVGIETTLFRRIYRKEVLLQLLLTFGLTLIIADVVRAIWGGEIYRLALPEFLAGSVELFPRRRFPVYSLILLVVGPAIAFGLFVMLRRTRFGRIVRAAVNNPEMLAALGIDVGRVFTVVFALGCWLAGLGGMLIAARSAVSLGMDSQIIVQAFAVVVIGGLGSFSGALLGALLIGVVLSIGQLYFPSVAQILPFVIMALVLIARPYGLLGKAER